MRRWCFDQIHKRNLIYNQCWEDPRIDRQALQLGPGDRIVMITSAGCNALDYLLSDPARIDCVDLNPHQTALLELKLAGLRALTHREFFEMFGAGRIAGHRRLYARRLRPWLSPASRRIWDRRIDYFDPDGPGLYFHGTAGAFARLFGWYIDRRPSLRADLRRLQDFRRLDEQAEFYRRRIAPRLWAPPIPWLLRRSLAMSLLGVPVEQVAQIHRTASHDLSLFIRERVDRVFTTVPIADNYFWRVYLNGRYTPECGPNYLKEENFEILRTRRHRIFPHTLALAGFLRRERGPYTVYVLLDHMDWLTRSPAMLHEEWERILDTAHPGARIIYRSGGATFNHVPEFARQRMRHHPEIAAALHDRDRVGTYGSFYLASVAP